MVGVITKRDICRLAISIVSQRKSGREVYQAMGVAVYSVYLQSSCDKFSSSMRQLI